MTTPSGYELPYAQRYARSRLTSKELASGLIQEELRAKKTGETTDRTVPDLFQGPPPSVTVTPVERVSQTLKSLSSRGRAQIKRFIGRAEYSEVIDRQSAKKKDEIASEIWRIVRSQKALLRDQHNNDLPISTALIENSGIKIETLGQDIVPTRPPRFRRTDNRDYTPSSASTEHPDKRYSLYSTLDNAEFRADAEVSRKWLERNPEGKNPLTPDGMAALGITSSSRQAGTSAAHSEIASNIPARNPENPRTRRR
ncbi:hypothetical protein [Streptomyces sp. NPDC097610]|uniref:hypothetical protein n=1 Tax=Streptomyces sp. NPDC097610 TaxID=3157227 RepID=UPI00332BFB53